MEKRGAWELFPWLKALVPLAAGIGAAECVWNRCGPDVVACAVPAVLSVCMVLLSVLSGAMCYFYSRLRTYASPLWFGFFLSLFLFVLGVCLAFLSRDRYSSAWPEEAVAARAVVADVPRRDERTVVCEADLLGVAGDGMENGQDGRRVQLFMQPTGEALSLRPGDGLLFAAVIRPPSNRGNPYEFDNVTYLRRRGVSGVVAWLPSAHWEVKPLSEGEWARLSVWHRLRLRALQLRDGLVERYRSAGLQGEALAVVSALTLGDKSALSRELRSVYSQAGASHLLALSGLHLGILLALLDLFLLRRLRYSRWYLLAALFAFVFIWGYVLLAGMPASLVRAASMYSFLLAATALGHRALSFNLLALTAFLMLLARPDYLFDVGFQLSCTAMAALLTLAPRLSALWQVKPRWLRPVWQTLVAGVAAQAGTAPLVAYYFHLFTPWAPVAGLLAIPLTTLLVAAAPLLWLSGWLVPSWELPSRLVAGGVGVQNAWLDWTASWPAARWEHLYPTVGLVLTFYVLLFLLFRRPQGSRLRKPVACGLVALLAGGQMLYNRHADREPSGVWFYNLSSCPVAHVVYNSSCSFLLTPCPDSVARHTRYLKEAYWDRRLLRQPCLGNIEDWETDQSEAQEGMVRLPGLTLLFLYDDRWRFQRFPFPVEVDYLYVARGYKGRLTGLQESFQPRRVVLDASLGQWRAGRYEEECSALGWPCHNLRTQGALRADLTGLPRDMRDGVR